jgi:hypothetical protein
MAGAVTEAAWLACEDNLNLVFMVGRLGLATRKAGGHRRLRLYAVACCRRIADLLDDAGRAALDVAEAQADRSREDRAALAAALASLPPKRPLYDAVHTAICAAVDKDPWVAAQLVRNAASAAALRNTGETWPPADYARHEAARRAEDRVQCAILRDVFNPFRPVAFAPAWRTPPVLALARAIYQERAFEQLPILADALEEAGCADEQLLAHCRGPGVHVRGCWVVDGVLARK